MKKLIRSLSILFVLGTCSVAFADLGDVMKDMASALKGITSQASDASQNASSASLCDQLAGDITTARAITPDSIAKLAAADQPAALAKYQQMLDTLLTQVGQLKADFVANNNAAVQADLDAIAQTKIAGHKAFKN
jgi:hypothetical protein